MHNNMDIVDRLEKYRLENRLSQQEIAEKLDVAFSTVNRWFNRKSVPRKVQSFHIQKLIESEARYVKSSR